MIRIMLSFTIRIRVYNKDKGLRFMIFCTHMMKYVKYDEDDNVTPLTHSMTIYVHRGPWTYTKHTHNKTH